MNDITIAMTPTAEELRAEFVFQSASPAEREQLLASNIFTGSSEKAVTPIELINGDRFCAVFERYEPASIKLWHVGDGIFRVPLAMISGELQQCFSQDATVKLQREVGDLASRCTRAFEQLEQSDEQSTESILALAQGIRELAEDMESLAAELARRDERIAELEAENGNLHEHCRRLEAIIASRTSSFDAG